MLRIFLLILISILVNVQATKYFWETTLEEKKDCDSTCAEACVCCSYSGCPGGVGFKKMFCGSCPMNELCLLEDGYPTSEVCICEKGSSIKPCRGDADYKL